MDEIDLSSGTQIRVKLDESAVKRYAELMKTEKGYKRFPPVILYRDDNGKYWPADGHHRTKAAIDCKRKTIRAEIRKGNKLDALKEAARINGANAVSLNDSDFRHAIRLILAEEPQLSNRALAGLLGCSQTTVRRYRPRPTGAPGGAPEKRVGKDGKAYSVSRQEPQTAVTESTPTEEETPLTPSEDVPFKLKPAIERQDLLRNECRSEYILYYVRDWLAVFPEHAANLPYYFFCELKANAISEEEYSPNLMRFVSSCFGASSEQVQNELLFELICSALHRDGDDKKIRSLLMDAKRELKNM